LRVPRGQSGAMPPTSGGHRRPRPPLARRWNPPTGRGSTTIATGCGAPTAPRATPRSRMPQDPHAISQTHEPRARECVDPPIGRCTDPYRLDSGPGVGVIVTRGVGELAGLQQVRDAGTNGVELEAIEEWREALAQVAA